MLTTSAVLIAAFLGLKAPSIAIAGYSSEVIALVPAWRFWVVALLIVTYQSWRYATDNEITGLCRSVALDFTNNMRNILRKEISKAVKYEATMQKACRRRVSFLSEPLEQDIAWDRASITPVLSDASGQSWPLEKLLDGDIQCSVPYVGRSKDGLRSTSAGFGIHYRSTRWQRAFRIIKTAIRTVAGSPHCQDVLVPAVLAVLTITTCAWKIWNGLAC